MIIKLLKHPKGESSPGTIYINTKYICAMRWVNVIEPGKAAPVDSYGEIFLTTGEKIKVEEMPEEIILRLSVEKEETLCL